MLRKIVIVGVTILLVPLAARAKVDLACSGASKTSAVTGTVKNANGAPVAGMLVELYPAGQTGPTRASSDKATTDGAGFYRICQGETQGSHYDTYDVHVREQNNAVAPLYATATQPYATYSNFTGDADFTPASGHPLLYMANLTITPNAISTATAPKHVVWTVRSKAPASTSFDLTVEHSIVGDATPRTVPMASAGTESGGPSAGGWNVWTFAEDLPLHSAEQQYLAKVAGSDGAVKVTQSDARPYVIDNTRVVFGKADATVCGSGVVANAFAPAPPLGTTNHRPTVVHDVCDPVAGTDLVRSGPDPYSLQGWMCPGPSTPTTGCAEINPFLNTRTITWVPTDPLATGNYYVRWRIADFAGNVTDSAPQWLKVGDTTGQVPFFTALSPGNFGSGSTGGIVIGSSVTSPPSTPVVGFRLVDNDGPTDIVPGAVDVRVYFGDEHTLIYEYDPAMGKDEYDPITKKGGADFDLSTGLFKATGYDLRRKPPGRYIVSASATDFGGNNASVTWHFILVGAV